MKQERRGILKNKIKTPVERESSPLIKYAEIIFKLFFRHFVFIKV